MRIVDADEVKKAFIGNRYGTKAIEYVIDNLPTVKAIPIDKPFLKTRYGDYVVYDKKWLVNHLQTEWNILQGKEYQPSIPIEWIKEHYAYYGIIKTLIEDWEKENE